ncbi:MAG TPA: DUF362 domain-containing protein [Acidobacteriota bacterium]|nr:DUF362 domain-containing protein [Acidobacteriota bacterium]
MERRTFLKNIAGCGVISLAGPAATLFARESAAPACFGLHPFIESHPEAVFIRRTNVASKNDSEGKRRESFELAKQIFGLRDGSGIPLTHKFAIKPNLTSAVGTGTTYAIDTDPSVVEGFIEGLKQVGIGAERIYARDGLQVNQPGIGYSEMAQRTGAHYSDSDSRTPIVKECLNGVVFKRTKFLGPFNYDDSYLINISKFKTHSMGLTLCVKNLQGTNAPPYIRFCGGLQNVIAQDFQADAQLHVDDLQARHMQAGFPRWDTEKAGWMEMWAQRTIDSYSLIKPSVGLNIIEGVYGQNGNGFHRGPGPSLTPEVFMTNMLIFGKDAFRVDIIGHWLGGHEPGNFGLFHIGKERGVSSALNPRNIPIYVWEDGGPKLTPLDRLTRTPLKSPYLARQGEPEYHMCDEPFSYPAETAAASMTGAETPGFQVLSLHGSKLVIEYNLPSEGYALLDLYNDAGDRIAELAHGRMSRGLHVAEWSTRRAAAGIYYCRLRTGSYDHAERIARVYY